jgi:hypothetical protein
MPVVGGKKYNYTPKGVAAAKKAAKKLKLKKRKNVKKKPMKRSRY